MFRNRSKQQQIRDRHCELKHTFFGDKSHQSSCWSCLENTKVSYLDVSLGCDFFLIHKEFKCQPFPGQWKSKYHLWIIKYLTSTESSKICQKFDDHLKMKRTKTSMVIHTYNSSTWKMQEDCESQDFGSGGGRIVNSRSSWATLQDPGEREREGERRRGGQEEKEERE
jgi:hypothetical protein